VLCVCALRVDGSEARAGDEGAGGEGGEWRVGRGE
jgi:hypothetical protein